MKVLAVRELKERIDEILHLVEEGETVEVVDRGKVVVRLVPGNQPEQAEKRDHEAFWKGIDRYAAEIDSYMPEKVDAVEIVREGRRDLGYSEAQTDKTEQLTQQARSAVWTHLERLAAEIGAHWKGNVSAVDAVRDVRREL
jgi:antitoxin (DNA-binding transcriptional repressor) of toxin-antitoxin stability system